MGRTSEVRVERRRRALDAHSRWKGFQITLESLQGAKRNLDGSVPVPRVAPATPVQVERFEARERLRTVFDSVAYRGIRRLAERQIGATLDFVDLPPDEQALKAGRPVVRIVTIGAPGMVPEGFASGFLVAPNLILTNHHVFRDRAEARGTGVQFLYERTASGLRQGLIFALEPETFFVNDKGLDYAVVAVAKQSLEGAPLSQFQFLPLIAAKGKIQKGDPVNIIQYPEGRPKQYATVNNQLLDIRDDGFLLYETDTLEGSSGSPVYNQHWESIALHHCGVPRMEGDKLVTRDGRRVDLDAEVDDSDLIWIANEGIRVSAIVASLADKRFENRDEQRLLEALIATTKDPLCIVEEKSPLIAGSTLIVPPTISASQSMTPTFNFTGPVTIVVNGQSPVDAAAAIVPPAAVIAAPIPELGFRETTLKFDEDYKGRSKHGYKSKFLTAWEVPAPTVTTAHRGALLTLNGKPWIIPYYHYSLAMNKNRRLLAWAASNVDYSAAARKNTKTRKEYGGENWRLDPRVALEAPGLQIENTDFYAPAKKIDRGHIVRREDGAWGASAKEAEYGNSDTYHWTNCTPQSEAFNQSGENGIWGKFEEHIQSEVKALDGRMIVFAGPVLNPADPKHGYDGLMIQVPMEFWKVVLCVAKENGKNVRLAYGFVFDQTDVIKRLGFERMDMTDYQINQLSIAAITKKTGISFDPSVAKADVMKASHVNESVRGVAVRRIETLDDVVLTH